jgi:hypothetical protein
MPRRAIVALFLISPPATPFAAAFSQTVVVSHAVSSYMFARRICPPHVMSLRTEWLQVPTHPVAAHPNSINVGAVFRAGKPFGLSPKSSYYLTRYQH